MGTQARIAVQIEGGLIMTTSVNLDGYVLGVGKSLLEHHNSMRAATDLIGLGCLSYVEGPNVCAYHRDRREDWEYNHPLFCESLASWLSAVSTSHNYIYMEGAWHYVCRPYPRRDCSAADVVLLSDALVEAKLEDEAHTARLAQLDA